MSTASDQQCIEQLNKNSISKLTSYVKSTDSHSFFFFLMFIYFWERETECKQGRSRKRGRHRIQSRLQDPSCQHRARGGAKTHKPWDPDLIRRVRLRCLTNWAIQAPLQINIYDQYTQYNRILSTADIMFNKIDHVLGYKQGLINLKRWKSHSIFSHHNGIIFKTPNSKISF